MGGESNLHKEVFRPTLKQFSLPLIKHCRIYVFELTPSGRFNINIPAIIKAINFH